MRLPERARCHECGHPRWWHESGLADHAWAPSRHSGMGAYNGFSPGQRTRALRWLRAEETAGRRQRPDECQACGQLEGSIGSHSENYGEPFGEHTGAFALCYRCHMMVHSRFSAPEAWSVYVTLLEEGYRWPGIPATYSAISRFLGSADEVARLARQGGAPHPRPPIGDPGLLRRIGAGEYAPAPYGEGLAELALPLLD